MTRAGRRLVLASRSPRRQRLLALLVPDFDIVEADVNEVAPRALPIPEALQVIARKKALAVSKLRPDDWVLGADTIVSHGTELLGKARSEAEARLRLVRLIGEAHRVWTGVALARDGRAVDAIATDTVLRMDRLPVAVLDAYIASGRWEGKAGGYGIQDALLAPFLHITSGTWSNVVGLPLGPTSAMLRRNGIPCVDPPSEDDVRSAWHD